jgi:hypothetical protein
LGLTFVLVQWEEPVEFNSSLDREVLTSMSGVTGYYLFVSWFVVRLWIIYVSLIGPLDVVSA